ncbi:MAG: hypothetical protein KAQ65_09215 [Candidatus Thorarchaeota archaeon]|nr:hypothetical protein [Candidatus Thorarchaeota archaeon]MCK5239495.1 hypothetical protein [Candidatus Thorarchaeota archaeon]
MKKLGEFSLRFKDAGSQKTMPIEVLVDRENTTVILDCDCCQETLSSKLPGGILIPIASTLKKFFEGNGMRIVRVRTSGNMMRRTYKGVMDEALLPDMISHLETRITEFSKRRKS